MLSLSLSLSSSSNVLSSKFAYVGVQVSASIWHSHFGHPSSIVFESFIFK